MGNRTVRNRVTFPSFALMLSSMLLVFGSYLLSGADLSASRPALAASSESAPVVERVDPTSVVNTAATTISVLGTDFAAVLSGTQIISRPTVLLNEDPLLDVGWVSSTTLTATVPAGYPVAIYDVTVENPDGLADTLAQALIVQHPTPQLAALDPGSGTYGQVAALTLTGSDFVSKPLVLLDTTLLSDVSFIDSTTLTATVPATLPPGYYDLAVQNPGPGDVSAWMPDAFTLYSPPPTVKAVSPQKSYNDMDTPLVITGTNFAPTPAVFLGDTVLEEVTWVSMTQLTAKVPWGLAPATYALTVTNPAPGAYSASLSTALTMTEGFNTWTTGGPYGGHIQEVAIHPLRTDTLYALATDVGIFASSDSGESWEMILREDRMTRIAFDAQDPLAIYIGGDGYLLRTRDGGLTWEEITPQLDPWTQAYNLYRPLAHPTQGCVLYAGKRSPDEPDVEPGGVYRSADCGATWAKWGDESTGLTDTHVVDLAFHPDNADIIVAGTQSGNLFRSDDAGQSWVWQAQVAPRVEKIFFNPFGDHEAWLLTSPYRAESEPPFVYVSSNLIDWTPVPAFDSGAGNQPVTDLAFPAPDTIWAASGYGMVSTDGGATWAETAGWAPVLDVDGAVSFAADPDAPNVLYGGHFLGGVSSSSDGGATWQRTSQGLAGVIPHALAIAPADPETLYAYTTRGLLKSENGGRSWQSLEKWIGGKTGKHLLAVDPFLSGRVYLGQPCDGALCLWISEDGGQSWREISSAIPTGVSGYRSVINILSPHPTEPGRIFAGVAFYTDPGADVPAAGGIFISEDYGEQWSFLAATDPLGSVEEIVYDAVDPGQIYAGAASTGIWKSVTGGATWQQLNVAGLAPPVGVESLAAHPDRSDVLLARLLSAAETANPDGVLYVSWDAGSSWIQLDDGTSDSGLWFAPPAPEMPPYMLYTGCSSSPCRSLDVGTSWHTIYGVPAPSVMASATDGERIVVYAASPGGMAAAEEDVRAAGATNVIPGRGSALGSGVYRTTLRPLDQHLYLPLVTGQAAR